MSVKYPDWKGSVSFEEYVVGLFYQNKTNTEEFQRLLRFKGRDYMEALWRKYKAGDYPRRDPVDEAKNQPESVGHQPEKKTANPKATSYVERSCPADDL